MNSDLNDCIRRIAAEGGGLFDIYVFQLEQIDALLLAAFVGGDAAAKRLIRPVANAAARIFSAPRKKPALCLTCPRPVRGRTAVCSFCRIATARRRGSVAACVRGAQPWRQRVLSARVQTAVRRIWPNARTIGRVSEGPGVVQ